jgi:hypothetical protein
MFIRTVLLPLQIGPYGEESRGLMLVPTGPGIVRRIGVFQDLHANEFQDVSEQEITIV